MYSTYLPARYCPAPVPLDSRYPSIALPTDPRIVQSPTISRPHSLSRACIQVVALPHVPLYCILHRALMLHYHPPYSSPYLPFPTFAYPTSSMFYSLPMSRCSHLYHFPHQSSLSLFYPGWRGLVFIYCRRQDLSVVLEMKTPNDQKTTA